MRSIWSTPITDLPIFGAVVWPGLVQLTAKADGTLGGYRLGMRCAWAVMCVMEAHRHALACTGHAGHIYLVRECNVEFMVVHLGALIGLDIERLWELVACRDCINLGLDYTIPA